MLKLILQKSKQRRERDILYLKFNMERMIHEDRLRRRLRGLLGAYREDRVFFRVVRNKDERQQAQIATKKF